MEANYQIEMLEEVVTWVEPGKSGCMQVSVDSKRRLEKGRKYWVTQGVIDAIRLGGHFKILQEPDGDAQASKSESNEIDLSKPMFQAVDAKTGEDVTEKLAKKPPKAGKRRGRPSGRKPGRPPKTAAPVPNANELDDAIDKAQSDSGSTAGTVTGFKV
jgi:hypothetical protein